jgi:hypothetical protein
MTDRLPPPAWPVLQLLACPVCRESLQPDDVGVLACAGCGRRWPERDGWLDFATFVRGVGERLPFRSGRVDAVLSRRGLPG